MNKALIGLSKIKIIQVKYTGGFDFCTLWDMDSFRVVPKTAPIDKTIFKYWPNMSGAVADGNVYIQDLHKNVEYFNTWYNFYHLGTPYRLDVYE